MPLYSPPADFVARLRKYDPLLRVRWSDRETRWRIERKITRGQWINPGTYVEVNDDFLAARDGFIHVMSVKHNQLDERVLFTLWATDLYRRGGAQRVADEVERAEEQARDYSRNKFLDELYDMAIERWNWANTLSPTKMSLHPDRKDEQ